MKEKLTYLFSLMLLCIFGTSSILADDQLIVSLNSDPEYSNDNSDCNNTGTSNNLATWTDGTSVKIMRGDKGVTSGNSITIGENSYKTIKVSNGAQNKLTMPSGKYAYSVDIYSYINKASTEATNSTYWREVNGTSYTTPVLTDHSDLTDYLSKPDKASYSLGGVSTFTFTNSGDQLCYILFITTTPIITQPASAKYGQGDTPTALTVGASSASTLSYQWYRCADANKTNPQAIDGATSASYSGMPTEEIGTYYYYCAVTDNNGTFNSDVATIEVVDASSLFTVTYSIGETTDVHGTVPSAEQASSVTIPTNTSLYKSGYTLTGWSDGTITYVAGDTYIPTANTTLTAVFTENTETLAQFKKEKTVTWYFGKSNNAADYDGSAALNLQQVKVKNTTIDLGIVMDGGSNSGRSDEWMNNQSKNMMVPVSKGAVVAAKVFYTNNATFNGETITYDEQYGTQGNVVYTYTYTGDDPTSIAVNVGNQFLSYISVTYPGTGNAWDNFEDFSIIVNNQTGTILTSDEMAAEGNPVSFGLNAENIRVAANDEDAIAVVTGKYHSDHGCTNLKVVVPVPGAVKIGVGQCTYSTSNIIVKNSSNVTVIDKAPTTECWKNDHNKITYQYYTGDATTLTISGMNYCPFFSISSVDMCELTGTVSGGTINGSNVVFTSTLTGQTYSVTVTDGSFAVSIPADTYNISLDGVTEYVLSSPTSLAVTQNDNVTVNLISSSEQTVSGAIVNAPVEDFVLTFTATSNSSNSKVLNCSANATSYTIDLMPDTYTMSSTVGSLSTLSAESFQVVSAAVTHNIYFPEAIPAATQQNITVDNTLATATANNYKSVSDALAAAKAGSISSPIITLTSGQTYREQVIVDMANVTLKTSGTEKAKITWYYGIGYTYYSLNASGYYDKDRAMTRNSKLVVHPARWGCTVKVTNQGNNFKAENIIFENSFNQYYTNEEVVDGVEAHPMGDTQITYDRTLTPADEGYKAADAKDVTERAAAIAFENSPTGCEVYNCKFISSQDTYYTSGYVYAKNCDIQGNTDYIFGGGHIVFDNCNLVIGGYSDKETSAYITAQKGNSGDAYIFRDCTVTGTNRTYVKGNLGRDWGGASATVYFFNLKNEIGNKLDYKWSNMGGGVSAGTANLHIYDFDQTVNANYSTTGSTGANINGSVSNADALNLYAGVVSFLGFTPRHIYDDAVVLSDGEGCAYNVCRIAASGNVQRTVKLTRSISAGNWSTIVLPFAMTGAKLKAAFGDDVEVAELSDKSTADNLSFTSVTTSVTSTEANKPYAIKVASAFTSATIEDVTIAKSEPVQIAGSWSFVGKYETGKVPNGSYYFKSNKLYLANGSQNVKPFRAYFTPTTAGAHAAVINVTFDDDITGINSVQQFNEAKVQGIFNLNGQRVSQPAQRGLYIVNGKKVVTE